MNEYDYEYEGRQSVMAYLKLNLCYFRWSL